MARTQTFPDVNKPAKLDTTDWRILTELQKNGRITNVELANRARL